MSINWPCAGHMSDMKTKSNVLDVVHILPRIDMSMVIKVPCIAREYVQGAV